MYEVSSIWKRQAKGVLKESLKRSAVYVEAGTVFGIFNVKPLEFENFKQNGRVL